MAEKFDTPETLTDFGVIDDEPTDESMLDGLINNTAEVSQLLDSALASINTPTNAFSDFEEEDEEFDEVSSLEARQQLIKIVTLVRVFDDNQPLKVAYIRHGMNKEMEPFMNLILSAMTAKFRGKNAAGAYSQALIESKEAELRQQFKLLEIDPTPEERADAKIFDDHYRSLV